MNLVHTWDLRAVHTYSAIPFFRVLADSRFLPNYHNHVFRVLASSALTYVQYDFARWPILHIPVTYIGGHLQSFTADRAVHTYLYYDYLHDADLALHAARALCISEKQNHDHDDLYVYCRATDTTNGKKLIQRT